MNPLKSLYCAILVSTFAISLASANNQELKFSEVYSQYNSAVENSNTQDSVRFAKLALELGEQKFGKNTENVANLKYNLALSLGANEQPKAAFEVFEQVAEDYERLYGEYSAELIHVLLEQISINRIYKNNRKKFDFSDVVRSYAAPIRQASNIAKEIAESSPQLAAGNYYNLASILNSSLLNSRFFKYAYKANVNAEKYLLASVGSNDKRTVEIRFMLGKYMKAKGRKDSAIEYFENVVSTINAELDTSHPFELASHAILVDLYEAKGQSKKATEHCLAIGNLAPWNDDIDPTPLYRLSPTYPTRAARMRKDGTVVMSFSIDTFGFVKDIEVIRSSSDLFDRVAIEALEKWRYAPKIVSGQAVVAEGFKVQLDFTMKS